MAINYLAKNSKFTILVQINYKKQKFKKIKKITMLIY